ncbi:phosphotransferase family protein [Halobacteriales archaeon QS_8_69_26]|nr:MAG: phosphotransferase family protein [Halobacteriales archaeon QS_8_69_26]
MADDASEEYFDRLVDESALRAYLADELGRAEEFSVERHAAGHSNETLFLTWGDRDLVLRRPPPGETADTAHDVLREYRVIDALQDTEVPVPPTVLACDDESVLGADFYVMERTGGDVIRDEEPDRFATPEQRRGIGHELVDTLAAVHDLDHEAMGLGEFGYPEGFAERQVRRWSEQLTWAFQTTVERREVPALYEVMEWLGDNAPEDHPHTLVHGDFKLDNVMFAPGTPPELVAVFDWEMSTLGDPRTDLGWMLSYWRDPKDEDAVLPDLTPTLTAREGYPTRRELVDRWEERTGLAYEHDRFYRTLAVYKLAGLGEMFLARYVQGNADDPLYPKMEWAVPQLAERAQRIIEGEEPL